MLFMDLCDKEFICICILFFSSLVNIFLLYTVWYIIIFQCLNTNYEMMISSVMCLFCWWVWGCVHPELHTSLNPH